MGNDNIVVNLKEPAPNNATIEIKSIKDGATKVICQIPSGSKVVNVDGSNLPQDMYVVCYVVNSVVVDLHKFKIE